MTRDIAIDEAIAAALPGDWPEDYLGKVYRSTCEKCNHVFVGRIDRNDCKVCAPPKGAES